MHARCIEILIYGTSGMHAIKAAHHEMIDHIYHWLGYCIINALKGVHTFLHQHIGNLHAFLYHGHFVALFAVEAPYFAGVLHRHDTHAVSAGIGLDDDKRCFLDAVFSILHSHFLQNAVHMCGQTFLAGTLLKINLTAAGKIGINQPGIYVE